MGFLVVMMLSPDSPSAVRGRGDPRCRGDRGSSSWRATFSPQVVLASTVLALLAAGGVLWFAVDNANSGSAAPPGFDDTDATSELREGGDETDLGLESAPANRDDALDVDITLADTPDTTTLASVQADNPMVVNFFASWCAPCIAEMPDFEAVSQEVLDDVDFIGIAFQDRGDDAAGIVALTGVTYPWYRDTAGDLMIALGGIQMPSTAFIAADGSVLEMKPGVLSRSELRDRIERHFGVQP